MDTDLLMILTFSLLFGNVIYYIINSSKKNAFKHFLIRLSIIFGVMVIILKNI